METLTRQQAVFEQPDLPQNPAQPAEVQPTPKVEPPAPQMTAMGRAIIGLSSEITTFRSGPSFA